MRSYPDALVLDWIGYVGGSINLQSFPGEAPSLSWTPRNGATFAGTLREAVAKDITHARTYDRRCVAAFKRTARGSVWAADYLSPIKQP